MVGGNGAGSGLVQAVGEQAGGWVRAGACAQPGAPSSQCWTCQGQHGLKPFNLCMLIQLFHAVPQAGLCIATAVEEFAPALPRELQLNQHPHLEVPWRFRGAGLTPRALQLCKQLWREQRHLHAWPGLGIAAQTHQPLQGPVGSAGLHAPLRCPSLAGTYTGPALTGLNCCLLWTLHPKERLKISK